MKPIFFYVYFDFDFAIFSHKQTNCHERKCLFYQLKFDLQRSGYSMEYHGNHYFFYIKKIMFLQQESLISLILFNFAHAT